MDVFQCCRLCLSVQNLTHIFSLAEYGETYTEIIFRTTAIKVLINDNLPKHICTQCKIFINECHMFRQRCLDTEKTLLEKFKQKSVQKSKIEHTKPKLEFVNVSTASNISSDDIDDFNDDFCCSDDDSYSLDDYLYDFNDGLNLDDYYGSIDGMTSEILVENTPKYTSQKKGTTSSEDKKDDRKINYGDDVKNGEDNREDVRSIVARYKEQNRRNSSTLNENTKEERGRKVRSTLVKNKEQNRRSGKSLKTNVEAKTSDENRFNCEFCSQEFRTESQLYKHKVKHTKEIICEHCGMVQKSTSTLLRHCRAKHGYEKTDKCSYCDYRGVNPNQVKVHERSHTGERPYVCAQCGASFSRSATYHQHMDSHLLHKTVQCDLCPRLFKSVTLMRIHRVRHATRYTYACKVCDKIFACRSNVVKHLRKIHSLKSDNENVVRKRIGEFTPE